MHEITDPEPDASALSRRLSTLITDRIKNSGGKIGFDQFMDMALYAPGLGYYSAGAHKIGESGDFITAPEISPLFSRCIARQCGQVLGYMQGSGLMTRERADILEVGAGSGVMACNILMELEQMGTLPAHYYILEISADLRDRQRHMIQKRVPHLGHHVHWLEHIPEKGFTGIVLANEVLDAMPVHRIHIDRKTEQEFFVAADNGNFTWSLDALSSQDLQRRIIAIRQILQYDIGNPGYTTEINLAAERWILSIADSMLSGLILILDYGFPQREYYHPQRSEGTIMCHYRHRAHDNPLIHVGMQDITSHVNFTAIAEAAHDAGLTVSGYTTQGHFLLACGIVEPVDSPELDNSAQLTMAEIKHAQAIKKLTLPHEMGELFKVIALTRGLDLPLMGFAMKDDRVRL